MKVSYDLLMATKTLICEAQGLFNMGRLAPRAPSSANRDKALQNLILQEPNTWYLGMPGNISVSKPVV